MRRTLLESIVSCRSPRSHGLSRHSCPNLNHHAKVNHERSVRSRRRALRRGERVQHPVTGRDGVRRNAPGHIHSMVSRSAAAG